ncbi:MAG: metallophosphoesterase [Clostridiales bacterium]|nr:metallophosphoesterase [Clostridiales bacterium]
MIRIGVFSDSHGQIDLFEKAVRQLNNVCAIVHLGDCATDAFEVVKRTGREIITLNGNCDLLSREPLFRILEFEGKRLYLTHGHREHVKMEMTRLFYRAEEEGADAVLFGHTHIPAFKEIGGVAFLNPGAMKDGRHSILKIENGRITAEFLRTEI